MSKVLSFFLIFKLKIYIFVLALGFGLFYFKSPVDSVSSELFSSNLNANTKSRGFLFGKNFMEKEIWKDISDYEGYYQCSNLGNLKSLKRLTNCNNFFREEQEKILKQSISKKRKVKYISLNKKGKLKTFAVHRIIAKTFIKNPLQYGEINHKDGNPSNNNINNLEWCSRSQNMIHARDNGLHRVCLGEKNHLSKLKENDVLKIKSLKGTISGVKIAKQFNVHKDTIYAIWNNKSWKQLQWNPNNQKVKELNL